MEKGRIHSTLFPDQCGVVSSLVTYPVWKYHEITMEKGRIHSTLFPDQYGVVSSLVAYPVWKVPRNYYGKRVEYKKRGDSNCFESPPTRRKDGVMPTYI